MEELLRRGAKNQKVRFGIVGVINTVVDFVVLLCLTLGFGLGTGAANIISSSCALATSYVLNKKAVFRGSGGPRQLLLFVVVTVVGIWLVQTGVVVYSEQILRSLMGASGQNAWALIAAKIVGTGATFVWNYLWYSRVVFRHESDKK